MTITAEPTAAVEGVDVAADTEAEDIPVKLEACMTLS